jgi:tetratricopeptide (TPR) repeat protein
LLVVVVIAALIGGALIIANADTLRDVIILQPTPEPTRSAASYAASAALLERDGEYAEAIDAYEQALLLEAERAEFYQPLVRLLTLTGRPDDALEWAEKALELASDDPRLWAAVAAARLANGDRLVEIGEPTEAELAYAEAVSAAQAAVDLDPNYVGGYAYLALALTSPGVERYVEAQEMAQIAIELGPEDPVARQAMAVVLEVQGYYEDAIEQYQLALEQNPPNVVELYIGLAYNQYAVGNIPEAILTFQRAIDIDPNSADAYDGLGFMYFLIGEYPDAADNLTQAVELDPQMIRAKAHLGAAQFRQNDYVAAIEQLETAVDQYGQVSETNAPYFIMLGLAYYRQSQDCNRAAPLFNDVLALIPDHPDALEGVELCHAVELESP